MIRGQPSSDSREPRPFWSRGGVGGWLGLPGPYWSYLELVGWWEDFVQTLLRHYCYWYLLELLRTRWMRRGFRASLALTLLLLMSAEKSFVSLRVSTIGKDRSSPALILLKQGMWLAHVAAIEFGWWKESFRLWKNSAHVNNKRMLLLRYQTFCDVQTAELAQSSNVRRRFPIN